MNGTELSADNFTVTQDEKLCNITLSGKTENKDISHLVLQPLTPANGLKNTVTVYISGTAPSGIETIKTGECEMENTIVYDLSGRRVENPSHKGFYIMQGKKIVVK